MMMMTKTTTKTWRKQLFYMLFLFIHSYSFLFLLFLQSGSVSLSLSLSLSLGGSICSDGGGHGDFFVAFFLAFAVQRRGTARGQHGHGGSRVGRRRRQSRMPERKEMRSRNRFKSWNAGFVVCKMINKEIKLSLGQIHDVSPLYHHAFMSKREIRTADGQPAARSASERASLLSISPLKVKKRFDRAL